VARVIEKVCPGSVRPGSFWVGEGGVGGANKSVTEAVVVVTLVLLVLHFRVPRRFPFLAATMQRWALPGLYDVPRRVVTILFCQENAGNFASDS
jgi:hypothetical protein